MSSIRQDAAYASYQRCCGGKASSIRRSFLDFDFDGFVAIGFHSMAFARLSLLDFDLV